MKIATIKEPKPQGDVGSELAVNGNITTIAAPVPECDNSTSGFVASELHLQNTDKELVLDESIAKPVEIVQHIVEPIIEKVATLVVAVEPPRTESCEDFVKQITNNTLGDKPSYTESIPVEVISPLILTSSLETTNENIAASDPINKIAIATNMEQLVHESNAKISVPQAFIVESAVQEIVAVTIVSSADVIGKSDEVVTSKDHNYLEETSVSAKKATLGIAPENKQPSSQHIQIEDHTAKVVPSVSDKDRTAEIADFVKDDKISDNKQPLSPPNKSTTANVNMIQKVKLDVPVTTKSDKVSFEAVDKTTTVVKEVSKAVTAKEQVVDNRIPSVSAESAPKLFDELEEFQQLLEDDFMQPNSSKINKAVSPAVDVRRREPSNENLKKATSIRGNLMKSSNLFADDDDQDDIKLDSEGNALGNSAFAELNRTNISLKGEHSRLKGDLNDTNKSIDSLQRQLKLLTEDNVKLKTQVQRAVVVPSLYGNNATKAVVLPVSTANKAVLSTPPPPPIVNNVVGSNIDRVVETADTLPSEELKNFAYESNVKLDETSLLMGSVGAADLAKSNTRLKTEISQLKLETAVKIKQLQELRSNYEIAMEEQTKLRNQLQKNPNSIIRNPLATPVSNTATTKLTVHSTAKKLGFDQSRITVS